MKMTKLNGKRIKTKILAHGDMVKINDVYGTIGTTRGYAAQYGENPEKAYRKQIKERKELKQDYSENPSVWALKEADFISNSDSIYEKQCQKRLDAINLNEDNYVLIEGDVYSIKWLGTCYSDFIHFKLLKKNIK